MKIICFTLCMLCATGCTHSRALSASSVVGTYGFAAFDLGVELHLLPDGTFRETEEGPMIVLGPNGERPAPRVRDQGRFIDRGDSVILLSSGGARRVLRKIEGRQMRLRETSGRYDRDYTKEKRPNHSPEPTALSVTPRADARVAPASTVAHL